MTPDEKIAMLIDTVQSLTNSIEHIAGIIDKIHIRLAQIEYMLNTEDHTKH